MNYIYDIVVNFNPQIYEFFEWKKNDNVINVRKIPLFRVSDQDYLFLKYNDVKLEDKFICQIENMTSTYTRTNLGTSCLISNTKESIGLLFDKQGNVIKRSCLIFDEEEEVNSLAEEIEITDIIYIKNQKKEIVNMPRIEKEKRTYLEKYLKKLDIKDSIKIKYLYYDYFDEEEDDPINAKKRLIKEINNDWNNRLDKLYDLVKLLKIKN